MSTALFSDSFLLRKISLGRNKDVRPEFPDAKAEKQALALLGAPNRELYVSNQIGDRSFTTDISRLEKSSLVLIAILDQYPNPSQIKAEINTRLVDFVNSNIKRLSEAAIKTIDSRLALNADPLNADEVRAINEFMPVLKSLSSKLSQIDSNAEARSRKLADSTRSYIDRLTALVSLPLTFQFDDLKSLLGVQRRFNKNLAREKERLEPLAAGNFTTGSLYQVQASISAIDHWKELSQLKPAGKFDKACQFLSDIVSTCQNTETDGVRASCQLTRIREQSALTRQLLMHFIDQASEFAEPLREKIAKAVENITLSSVGERSYYSLSNASAAIEELQSLSKFQ